MTLHRAHLRVLMAVAVAAGLLLSPAAARGDAVSDWSKIAAEALLLPPSPPSPPGQGGAGQGAAGVAHLAMVHGAIFDAVNSIDRRYEPYLVQIPARRWYSRDAAVAAAAHRVLVSGHVVRDDAVDQQTPLEARVEPEYAAALAAIPDGRAKWRGIAVGEAAAWFMIAERTGDGRFDPPTGGFDLRPPGPGVWQPVPPEASVNDPGAWLKDTTPFLLRHPTRFLSRGPDPLTSRRYARDFNEVKALGDVNSTVRTAEQTAAARFWGGPTNAVLTWTGMIRTLAGLRPLSTVDSARFYALVYLTAADALIVTWKDKQKWMFWRPNAAIRKADTDGNPATEADPDWSPLIGNPPYPEHPSGLSTLGGSNVATLQELFGTDEVAFEAFNSLRARRTYARLSQVIAEIVDARVWSGVHFRNSDEQGAEIGRDVARWRRHHGFLERR